MSASEIINTAAACQQLLSSATKLILQIAGLPEEINRTARRLEASDILLSYLRNVFERYQGLLSQDRGIELSSSFRSLEESLRLAKGNILKFQSAKGKLGWIMLSETIKETERDLFEWLQRFAVIATLLLNQLKEGIVVSPSNRGGVAGDLQQAIEGQSNMQRLVEQFGRAALPNSSTFETISRVRIKDIRSEGEAERTLAYLDGVQPVLIDAIHVPSWRQADSQYSDSVRLEAFKLYQMLGYVHPKLMHLQRARGVLEDQVSGGGVRLGIIYEIPPARPNFVSLIELIRGDRSKTSTIMSIPKHSLSQRIKIAQHIVIALSYVHSTRWVHKAVRSSNILLFHLDGSEEASQQSQNIHSNIDLNPEDLGNAFLTGFSLARRQEAISTGIDTFDWRNGLYEHPDRLRQADNSDEISRTPFRVSHDIYSLGVVLLELGVWRAHERREADVGPRRTPDERRMWFQRVARTRLASSMGDLYTKIVIGCLDGSIEDTETVLSKLADIRM
ncbi:MAG: hypothetical protein Q9159_004078 [Coniocarpon cinnabarinum]